MSVPTVLIRFFGSESELPAALWDACFPPPLEGRWWYRVLEASQLEDQFQFLYGLITVDGVAVGIAPVFVMNAPVAVVMPEKIAAILEFLGRGIPSLLFQKMLFVGSPCSDEGTVGFAAPVDRVAVFLALQAELELLAQKHRAKTIIWKDFPGDYIEPLQIVAEHYGMFRLESFPGTHLPLTSGNKADYFSQLKGSRRHQVRKKIRQSHERVELTSEVVIKPSAAVLDEVFGLFSQTYERSDTKFERLGRTFFTEIAEQDASAFILLRESASGALVAFMLCFHVGSRVINKFIGFDYARPREWLLYFRLWEAALDWTLSLKADSLQSGQTGYAAKIEVGHELVPLTNFCRHRNPLMNAVYKLIARRISWETLDDDLARYLRAHPESRGEPAGAADAADK